MTLSNRDKVLVVILPAFLITVGYGWTMPGKHKQLAALMEQRDTLRQQAPPPEMVRGEDSHVADLSLEVAKQQKALSVFKQRWDDVAAKCGSPELRNERIKKLTTLVMHHHLTVLDDSEAEAGKGKLPLAMEQLAQQLVQLNKNLKPQLRQLHLRGGYLDLHHVLQELSEGEVLAIPVSLTMKTEKDGGSQRDWTLMVWI